MENLGFEKVGNLNNPQMYHNAITLNDGRVLIVGGKFNAEQMELYNPKTKSFSLSLPLGHGTRHSKGIRLANGNVLIFSRNDKTYFELFNPLKQTLVPAGELSQREFSLVPLNNNDAILAGGFRYLNDQHTEAVSDVVRYDSQKNTFNKAGSLKEHCNANGAAQVDENTILFPGQKNFQLYNLKTQKIQLLHPSEKMKQLNLKMKDMQIIQTDKGDIFVFGNRYLFPFDKTKTSFKDVYLLPMHALEYVSSILFSADSRFVTLNSYTKPDKDVNSKASFIRNEYNTEINEFKITPSGVSLVKHKDLSDFQMPPYAAIAITGNTLLFSGGDYGGARPVKTSYIYHL